jgi:predicted CXXCH cytochrome family protein
MNSFKGNNKLLLCCTLAFVLSAIGGLSTEKTFAQEAAMPCTDCHTEQQSAKFPHTPVIEGECTSCHEPEPSHLTAGGPGGMKTGRTASTCYQCHDNLAAGSTVHPVLQMEGECIQCHNPHGSSVEKLLVKPLDSLCNECHAPVPAEAVSGSQHSPVTEGRSCMNCHNPHSSNQAALLLASSKTLCLGCHDQKISTKKDKDIHSVQNIKEKLAMPYVHAPAAEDGGCKSCHAAHGSKYKKLLTGSFPEKNYYTSEPGTDLGKDIFGLCFGCHDPALLNKDISAADTGFRNDTVKKGTVLRNNLHRLHVVEAGKRSCNICHDPHGTTQPHNLRSKWTMKKTEPTLLFENRPDGGECLKSCHSAKRYQRLD